MFVTSCRCVYVYYNGPSTVCESKAVESGHWYCRDGNFILIEEALSIISENTEA